MKLLTLTAVAAATLTACTPHEISVFAALAPHQRDAVADHLNRSADCFTAVDRWWPTTSRARAKQVVWRESRNQPDAANDHSTARGCFELLLSYHAWRFREVGCQPSQWADPDCNTRAALHLFEEQGWQPWALTA